SVPETASPKAARPAARTGGSHTREVALREAALRLPSPWLPDRSDPAARHRGVEAVPAAMPPRRHWPHGTTPAVLRGAGGWRFPSARPDGWHPRGPRPGVASAGVGHSRRHAATARDRARA